MCDWTATLNRDGCCVLPKVIDPATIPLMLAALDVGGTSVSRRSSSIGRRNVLDVAEVRQVADSPQLRKVVEAALGPDTIVVRGLMFDKTPEANWTVPWHQDRSIAVRERLDVDGFGPWSTKAGVVHVQPPVEVLRGMVTIRLHLDDCDETNGPLRIVPGSHRDLLDAASVDAAVAAGDEVAMTCPAGGAVVMRPLVLHASSPATSPRHRRVLHLEYAASALPGGLAWAFSRESRRASAG